MAPFEPFRAPVASLTAASSKPSAVAVSKSPRKTASTRWAFECGGQRSQSARSAGDVEVPGAHHRPAGDIPERDGRSRSEKAPLEPVLRGNLIPEECVNCPSQARLCRSAPVGDHGR